MSRLFRKQPENAFLNLFGPLMKLSTLVHDEDSYRLSGDYLIASHFEVEARIPPKCFTCVVCEYPGGIPILDSAVGSVTCYPPFNRYLCGQWSCTCRQS